MKKEFYKDDFKLGGDGGKGDVVLGAEDGFFKLSLSLSFPVIKALQPIAKKAKDLLPDWADKYADEGVEALAGLFGIEVKDLQTKPETQA